MISIIFRGKLIDGHNPAQVIVNLSKITKMDPAEVKARFFSGKAVVIKRLDEPALAKKYRQLFAKAGSG